MIIGYKDILMKIMGFISSIKYQDLILKVGKYHVLWWVSYELSITRLTDRLILVSGYSVTNQNNYLDGGENVWYLICVNPSSHHISLLETLQFALLHQLWIFHRHLWKVMSCNSRWIGYLLSVVFPVYWCQRTSINMNILRWYHRLWSGVVKVKVVIWC